MQYSVNLIRFCLKCKRVGGLDTQVFYKIEGAYNVFSHVEFKCRCGHTERVDKDDPRMSVVDDSPNRVAEEGELINPFSICQEGNIWKEKK